MVFNNTFNNISVISWQSVLLVEETRVVSTQRKPPTCHKSLTIISHSVVSITSHHQNDHEWDSNSQLLVVIDIDCTGSGISNAPQSCGRITCIEPS